jgi:hypothetical protein
MDQTLSTVALLTAAIVAFVAVGCDAPTRSAQPTSVAVVTTAATPPPTAPVAMTQVVRAPAAQLALTPQPAPQSGQVQISGKSFSASEPVTIVADQLQLATTTTDPNGDFDAVTLTLPDQLQSGPHPIHALGQTSGRDATATLWIRAPQPWLVLDNYDVQQYGDFGFVAGGFQPMDQVRVSLDPKNGQPVQLVTLTTDQAGNAAWTQLKLPALAAGSYAIVLQGEADSAALTREVHITSLKPTMELSPWAGPPGVPVQFNARGFAPSEHIHASVGTSTDPTVLQADEYGNLWAAGPIRIPQTAPSGPVDLDVIGDESGASAIATFKVLEPKPWLELTAWSGAPGAPVGFGGGGWIGGEPVGIHLGSATNPIQTVGAADDNGWLKVTDQVYVPLDAADELILVAVGERSHLVAAATFKIVLPFGLRPAMTPVPGVQTGG